jgi:uncharacterized protein YdhG (YjbR/CyaY superfamily)
MGTRDARIDAYIGRSANFARPVLSHLRELVHAVCPEVAETMKWSFPNFTYRGAILCQMAAFQRHCTFGFWNADRIPGAAERTGTAMGQLGRIGSTADLPPDDVLADMIRQAMRLAEAGVKPRRRARPPAAKPVEVPAELAAALREHPAARGAFAGVTPGQRRDYAEWIAEAKTDATRQRRLATALEWLAEGRTRNWRYERRGKTG